MKTIEVRMNTQASAEVNRVALERRFYDFGWGVLLIAIGTIWLLPAQHVPRGSWLIAAGLVMLGLNGARFVRGLRISGFSVLVGTLALIAGLGEFFAISVPLLPVALILIGVYSLVKTLRFKDVATTTDQGWNCCGPRGAGQ